MEVDLTEADFSGYATKAGLKCTDGRTIKPEAFAHQDKVTVPLVWQHGHNSPTNILGHAVLEARPDGMYTYGFFNGTREGQSAKLLVQHKDVTKLSIYANQLKEHAKTVLHGVIGEVSLVIQGANKGAIIDYVRIQHSDDPDDVTVSDDEAVIHTALEIVVPETTDDVDEEDVEMAHATVKEIFDTLDDQQQNAVFYMIGVAVEEAQKGNLAQADGTNEGDLVHQEGTDVVTQRNVFDQTDKDADKGGELRHSWTPSSVKELVGFAEEAGSFKKGLEKYALAHGVTNVSALFPEAKAATNRPEWIRRDDSWVNKVLRGAKHLPYTRIKNWFADLSFEDARAKGYVTGEFKKEQWFEISQRTTSPTTVYKKQRMDRDTLLDITEFDFVSWLWEEMRFMLEEEVARAILIGDGRPVDHDDKIKDPAAAIDGIGIRSILNEHEIYTTKVTINLADANSSHNEIIKEVLRARKNYKGTGRPTMFTTNGMVVEMLLLEDTSGRRLYNTITDLAAALMVESIVEVEVMEDSAYERIIGIFVNMSDYSIGTDKGGEVTTFDDFNIDYNKYTYLIETRLSGALVKYKSALVVMKPGVDAATGDDDLLVVPNAPTFVPSTGVLTIVATTGVVYKNDVTGATLSTGAQTAIAAGATIRVRAEAAAGYYLRTNNVKWAFRRDDA